MKTLAPKQILAMLQLQDKMNCVVNPDWRAANYKWTRAILVETVEAIDYCGWPWWKKQAANKPQLVLELVDIFHFLLSALIEKSQADQAGSEYQLNMLANSIATQIACSRQYQDSVHFNAATHDLVRLNLTETLELMAGMAACGKISVRVFDACIEKAEFDWQSLYASYIGKNCLNLLRQQHGYKTGSYIKDWSAVALLNTEVEPGKRLEDNDHLHDLISGLNPGKDDFIEALKTSLAARYKLVRAAQYRFTGVAA